MRDTRRATHYLLAGDKAPANPLFDKLSKIIPAHLSTLSSFPSDAAKTSHAVIVDLAGAKPSDLQILGKQVRQNGQHPFYFVVDQGNRLEVTQAQAFGAKALLPRDAPLKQIVRLIKMEDKVRQKQLKPAVDNLKINTAISKTDALFDEFAIAISEDAQLPLPQTLSTAHSLIEAMSDGGLSQWLTAVAQHHSYTYRHSMMVAGIASEFAGATALNPAETKILVVGALMHDIGKMKIPVAILDKPGKLTPQEYEIIKQHPVYGDQILAQDARIPTIVRQLTRNHHEMLDGSGYPDKLRDQQIPKLVRSLTICDIYTALIEQRAYKESLSQKEALAELERMKGKLDQQLLECFARMMTSSTSPLGEVRRPRNEV